MSTLNNYQVGGFIYGKDKNSLTQYLTNLETYNTHLFFDSSNHDLLINGVSFSYSKEARDVDASIRKDVEDLESVIVRKFNEVDTSINNIDSKADNINTNL